MAKIDLEHFADKTDASMQWIGKASVWTQTAIGNLGMSAGRDARVLMRLDMV